MLASSIDFEVELEPVAFVDRRQTRAFNRRNVNECIGLAIVANEETEALDRVEELNRTGRLLASQFATRLLRRAAAAGNRNYVTDDLKILSGNFATAIDKIEFQLLPFGQPFQTGTFDCGNVHEHIFTASFLCNEAEAFLAIEELHRPFAGADNLRGHAVETATTTAAAARTATATAAAETVTAAAAETVTAAAAETVTAAAAETVTAAEIIARRKTVRPPAERIEVVLAETIAFVPAATAPSVITHSLKRTFAL